MENSLHNVETGSNFSIRESLLTLKNSLNKSLLIPLTALTVSIATPSFAQTTVAQNEKIEQIQLTNDPQAKADMKALLAKYNVPSINDIWELDVTLMVKMRNDLCVYLDANTRGTYRLDTDVVALRDELGKQLASEIPDSEKKKHFKEIFAKVQQGAIKLAQTDEKLAKEIAKGEELKKIAKMMGVSENNINK
ncbi:hypothetical protein XF24_00900 [candidate division SR1 bacterium Aalborg_AAW-1]|nr:hypothetical protein XF24_00900 [candidate division SR1 bacterium Aalborg_AAW-1]